MTADIHSVDDERAFYAKRSKGKNSWVSDDAFKVTSIGGKLRLVASSSEEIGTGAKGGKPKDIKRTLTLLFSPKDLKRILNAALKSGLLVTSVSIAKPKKAKNK